MNKSRTIKTSNKTDIVTFKILIEGVVLSNDYGVNQIEVNKEVNRIPSACVTFKVGHKEQEDFKLSNQDQLIPGKRIEIKAGYSSDDETIFKGVVIKHEIKINRDSLLLKIECNDESVKLSVSKKSKYYYECADSDIFEAIIDSYGIEKDIESTNQKHKVLVQYHTSDWDFLVSRAQANGKLCFIDDGKISIKKPEVDQYEVETISYGDTLMEFEAEIDAISQVSKVSSYGWNPAKQNILEIEANIPNVQLNGNISSSDLATAMGLGNLELRHGGIHSDVELQDWANAKMLFQQLAKIRGRVMFQGMSNIKPGILLKLEGVGQRFNGRVYVTAIRHELRDGNWMVDAQFGLNPKWFTETFDINPQPASGLLAAVNGLQVGVVTQLQGDPDGEDRILVKLPIINNIEQGLWCRVASLDAGVSRGAFFRPELSDEVIVGFINDDPNDAIVLGMLNSSAKPAPLVASDDNHIKGFVTRSKMKILFDDDKKSLTIETPVGKKMVFDENAGSIICKDEYSNVLTMDSSGISIESSGDISFKATGDVNIEGSNVNAIAINQFKAEGPGRAELSSSGIAVVKGSLVQIN